jgi:hypothetical protein
VIRVASHVHSQRLAWFDGFDITRNSDGTSTLSGSVIDQAELHGVLAKVRDLNIALISVELQEMV